VELPPSSRLDNDKVSLSKLVQPPEGVGMGYTVPGDHLGAGLPWERSSRVVGRPPGERGGPKRAVEHTWLIALE
jgi:hypothetical protein